MKYVASTSLGKDSLAIAISGLKQTVLRSKTDAMRSERTLPVDIEIYGYLIMIKAIGKWYESFKEDVLC